MSGAVLVTGASGFVGGAIVRRLASQGRPVRAGVRQPARLAAAGWPAGAQAVQVGDLATGTDWQAALAGVRAVVHCAARVHVMRETAADPLAAFRQVNVDGSLRLARQAAAAGVRRFVFISSIGVNGASTTPGRPFTADDTPAPHSPYARSKLEAEQALQALARETGMAVTIIRPPLVYGPGAPGNFATLLKAVQRGWPLPLGAIHNRRSLVAVGNLAHLVETCLDHPAAASQTFLVSDGDDLSTTALLRGVGQALGRPARLIPVPAALLSGTARLLGRAGMAQQLCGWLQLDIGKTRTLLGWQPPLSVPQALAQAAQSASEAAGP